MSFALHKAEDIKQLLETELPVVCDKRFIVFLLGHPSSLHNNTAFFRTELHLRQILWTPAESTIDSYGTF
ncbi:hypothetical protein M5689_013380 [Euphorbia peplus]|nr:hypothetical protein M5689_013380 [Euphorbia peplus]